jgi:ornithine carbamoyltransferase
VPADQCNFFWSDHERQRQGAAMRHYLQFSDFTADEYAYLFERAALIKQKFKAYEKYHHSLVTARWP